MLGDPLRATPVLIAHTMRAGSYALANIARKGNTPGFWI